MSTYSQRWTSLPDIDAKSLDTLTDEYRHSILVGHSPTSYTHPFVLAATGLVASGKSTVTQPLADSADTVTVSTDVIREMLYKKGFNFRHLRIIGTRIIDQLINERYNLNLDFNIANDTTPLDKCKRAGYKLFIIHANPPESFIKEKIISGSMKHELTFFGDDQAVLEVMLRNTENHLKRLDELKHTYPIWREVDTSSKDLPELITNLRSDFLEEIAHLE